ncbi:MAG: hypothetical protein HY879_01650 [Deltaproteobacteria bacterium]|nr:hypothetical protein [Deltaproteobacteria bacterium]
MESKAADRKAEWFVPKFGPAKFRTFVGLLFLPYTAMVLSFSIVGSMLADPIHWERMVAMVVIYFLGLGIGAHALDALGSKGVKPWGTVFSRRQLWILAVGSLVLAYCLAIYFMVRYVPLLWPLALGEGFFVFAYNLEWLNGKFHTDKWFAFSWGFLPVLAGYIMQTNTVTIEVLALAVSMAFFSFVEIKASRPYKDLKQRPEGLRDEERALMARYETILKSISLGVIFLGGGLLIWRLLH